MRTKCGATKCEEAATVLVLTPILLRECEVPRCPKHLSKLDNYRPIERVAS